jgi:hypothetical protein
MILTKKIKININKGNIPFYKNKYKNIKIGDTADIDIIDVSKYLRVIVDVKCDICGKEQKILYSTYNRNISNYGIYTCHKCSNIKNKKTNLKRYGVESPLQNKNIHKKVIDTCLEKYGVENTFSSDEKKDKIKNTLLNRYRVNNPMKNENIKEKARNTCVDKYGVESFTKTNEYRIKSKKTSLKKYGVNHPMKDKEICDKAIENARLTRNNNIKNNNKDIIDIDNENHIYKLRCKNCNSVFDISYELFKNRIRLNTELCTICNPPNSSKSGYENIIHDFIKDNVDNEIIRNERKLLDNKYELDIYIPELKLAFEFNGLYWHNELNKPNKYHLEKTELCEEKSIQLIHIYEDDWVYKSDIIKSMILNKLRKTPNKIYARKCEIKEINDNKLIREFLEHNHIQGFIGSKFKIGLFHENELVSLMTFGKRRISMGKKSSQEGEYELLRFCSKLNTNVVGGANKLFKYFKDNYKPKFITTYADRSWSTGGLYYNLGFEFIGKTDPNYYYIIDGVRRHRFGFRKDVLVKEGYDSNKTEHDIMLDRGIYRIYDSGNLKFEFI